MRLDHLLSRERRRTEKVLRIPGRYDRGPKGSQRIVKRQSGKTDEKAGKTSGDRLFRLLRTLYRFEGSPRDRGRNPRILEKGPGITLNAP